MVDGVSGVFIFQDTIQTFKTIQDLLNSGYQDQALTITVLTEKTQQVLDHEAIRIDEAGLVGLVGTLAQEQTLWQVRLLDVEDKLMSEAQVEDLIHAPFIEEGTVIAYRNKQFFQLELCPVDLPPASNYTFKNGGTYVMMNGTENLGQITSSYLIGQYQANVIWIGDKGKDTHLKEVIKRSGFGGKYPVYFECDLEDANAIEKVYQVIKQQFKRVDGLFLLRSELEDRDLKELDYSDLQRSLNQACQSTRNLVEAFSQEPLDFVCCYSSFQSQFPAKEQGNDVAVCTYLDSFAHQLKNSMDFPIYLINWGPCERKIKDCSNSLVENITSLGAKRLNSLEAMKIVEQVLAYNLFHITALKF